MLASHNMLTPVSAARHAHTAALLFARHQVHVISKQVTLTAVVSTAANPLLMT